MKKVALSIFLLLAAVAAASWSAVAAARADAAFSMADFAAPDGEVTFEVATPTAVEAGELFRIEFVVNAIKEVEFTQPRIEGFEVLAGPSTAVSVSSQSINGRSTRIETTTYTYVLQGLTAGLHTISAATVSVRGKNHSTRPVTIEVVDTGSASGASSRDPQGSSGQGQGGQTGQNAGGQGQGQGRGSTPTVAADDIFLRAVVSRSNVYKGEPVVVSLKLYTRVMFVPERFDKSPTFNGFWQQDITPAEAAQQRETYNNRVYTTYTVGEYLLYPQQSGVLTIEGFEMGVTVRFKDPNTSQRDIFDQLMGLGGGFIDVPRRLASAPVKIEVRELPAGAPTGFTGAVGQFRLDATPPAAAMNANTSGTYTLRLSGTGNFPLVRAPKLAFPQSFEQYNVTTSDNTRHTRGGTSGYREFSYPFIPRSDGLYAIPALEFSYFDPRQGRYVSVSTKETAIEVAADTTAISHSGGLVSGIMQEELKIFGQDIQFIKRGAAGLQPKGRMLLLSPLWFALMALAVVLFVVGYFVLGAWVRNMQSDRFVRSKRANKLALKRFRAAEASMKQGDRHGFYDEMLKALWGYMSDRLDIPMANLTKDRVREELFERGVDGGQTDAYIRIISECEEAQYSPSSSVRMNELYREGIALVASLESAIKKSSER